MSGKDTSRPSLVERQRRQERQQNRRKYILITVGVGALLAKLLLWVWENV